MGLPRSMPTPYGCTHCGDARGSHGWQYLPAAGLHQWAAPPDAQILTRMKARRAARTNPSNGDTR